MSRPPDLLAPRHLLRRVQANAGISSNRRADAMSMNAGGLPNLPGGNQGMCCAIWEFENPDSGEWILYSEDVINELEMGCNRKESQVRLELHPQ